VKSGGRINPSLTTAWNPLKGHDNSENSIGYEGAAITQGQSAVTRNRRYWKRRRHRRPGRSHRRLEVWLVSIVAVGLLGIGISWIVSLAQPGGSGANFVGQPAGVADTPPVIIIQDNSARPDDPGK
jgi:hypothetical protein